MTDKQVLDQAVSDQIEHMIDSFGLFEVLDAIADIAHGKAEHIQHAWQDGPLATKWRIAAKRIERTANSIQIRGLSR